MDELEEEVVEMDEADAELRRLRADAELRRLREEDLVEQAATQANRSNALELIWQRQRDWHAQEQQERRALQTRARQSMESLRALVLREVAGLRQQVREAEQSATALHEELPALPSLVVHPVIRRLEAKVQEQDAQWGHDVDVLRRKLKAAAFETHQLRRSLVAAQAVLDGCMAEGLASKQSINILECRIADLEGQREDQREALRKSGVRVQALDNDCSRLRDAVLQTERNLAAAHAERDALQAQLRQLSAAHQELGAQVLRHKAQVMQVSTALCQQEEAAAASNMRWQRERQGCTAARREHAATKALMAMAKTRLAAFVCEMSQLQADMLQHARDQQCVHARGEDLRRQLEAAHVAQMARVRQESADRTVAFYVQQCALDHELDLKHAEMSVITSYVQRLLLECKTQVRLTAVRQKRPPASSPQPSSPQAVAAFSVTWAREEHSNACEIQQLHQRLDKVRRHAFARQIALRHLARALRCFEEVLAGVWERRSRACGLLARSQLPCRQSMWSRWVQCVHDTRERQAKEETDMEHKRRLAHAQHHAKEMLVREADRRLAACKHLVGRIMRQQRAVAFIFFLDAVSVTRATRHKVARALERERRCCLACALASYAGAVAGLRAAKSSIAARAVKTKLQRAWVAWEEQVRAAQAARAKSVRTIQHTMCRLNKASSVTAHASGKSYQGTLV